MVNPVVTDKGVGMKTHKNNSGSTEDIGLLSLGRPNTVAGAYVGRGGMITHGAPLVKGATSSILVASSTRGATGSSLLFQAEDFGVHRGMRPTIEGDEAGMQEHIEATPGGDDVAVGQYKEQIVVIHDSPSTMRNADVTPSTAGRRFPLMPGEVTKTEKKQEYVEVVPSIGAPGVL
ncbi:hypothetical protein BDP27DRAFT_1335496 [Rhodocollybia butyracea]|uniref:Uncharacterized protein n=1 Tax=Rhodocollybia butyracea TaxID=206335 RepID=A0A9P5U256_9AGAR|nr:hypothetical protein BDP27DRAFT_1335496 [Rhodocollybia butyracea]